MDYRYISDYIYDCRTCPTRCDGVSKGTYIFGNDTAFSERYEQLIIKKIIDSGKYLARKCEKDGYPDVEILSKSGETISYLEVKVQRRTFMSVETILPQGNLKPSETVALNLSDLLRYFEIKDQNKVPTSIVWAIMNRLCVVKQGEVIFFYQTIDKLRYIYNHYEEKRRFRRKSGDGDIVDGVHKGVTVNYHFSLKELKIWLPDKI